LATEQPTWGVTVEEVHALAPHVPINDSPDVAPDPVWDGAVNQAVTSAQVEAWIGQVANRAAMRLHQFDTLTDETRQGIVEGAAHDAVVNGAASYLVAAAYPAMSAPNEDVSYAQVLWGRFTATMNETAETLDKWADSDGPASGTGGVVTGFFPEPLFPDGQQW